MKTATCNTYSSILLCCIISMKSNILKKPVMYITQYKFNVGQLTDQSNEKGNKARKIYLVVTKINYINT